MKGETTAGGEGAFPDDDAVVAYLCAHPGFLRRHPEVLDVLEVSQGVHGAVSLLERQVERLREQNTRLRRHIGQLIEAARRNEDLGNSLHELALALLEAEDAEDVVAMAHEHLRSRCALSAMGLRIWSRHVPAPECSFTMPESEGRQRFETLLRAGRVLFPDVRNAAVQALLEGAEASSVVLVPVADGHWCGLLALGSEDPNRFREGMGTLFVSQLGALILRALRVRIEKAPVSDTVGGSVQGDANG